MAVGAVDATMRKLKVPPRFMPYLEKHRIYELFHDLGDQLAIVQPEDSLQFLKHCLEQKKLIRDRRLIFLLTPPNIDRVRLAQIIAKKTGCGIMTRYIMCKRPGNHYDAKALALNTVEFLKEPEKDGWILADYPDTEEEAKLLIKHGAMPTHTFMLLPNENDIKEIQEKCRDNFRSIKVTRSILFEYNNSIFRLEELFKASLKIVKIKDKCLEDIANACVRLALKMPNRNAPKYFRVALIGPRGSRRRTLAKLLQTQFKLVHIDMIDLINSARNLDNEVGDKIREYDRSHMTYTKKMVFDLLNRRLSQQDCITNGYVLTNYPRTLQEFVLLDSADTPPNKVIFLDIGYEECIDRLEDRVVNSYTGNLYSKQAVDNDDLLKSQVLKHPDDELSKVQEEIEFYNNNVTEMTEYCGQTSFIVDARCHISALIEKVEGVLMSSTPAVNPRSGKFPHHLLKLQKKETLSQIRSESLKTVHPISRTEVVPLIDSELLIQRFLKLKKSVQSLDSADLSLDSNSIDGRSDLEMEEYTKLIPYLIKTVNTMRTPLDSAEDGRSDLEMEEYLKLVPYILKSMSHLKSNSSTTGRISEMDLKECTELIPYIIETLMTFGHKS